jgi:hypothetical protein
VLICGAEPPPVFTETPSRQPPPDTRGKPTPSPTVDPALVIVTLIVPAAVTVNERLLVPPGASALDQISGAGFVGVDGAVAVLVSSPHAAAIAAKNTNRSHPPPLTLRQTSEDLEARRAIMGA